ncbi:MAG: hypothetical protein CME70_10935 [Halobacteriovorax sp.]|nr:hypothetical protein [Halobacteriovorax sp.]|tara:strand:+ start:39076 stop:39402 length:327 start_codon:yes stop_codon:yes gene_type:complete
MSKLKSGRIILDEGAKSALSSMYDELKNEACIKVTPAKLSSWIIQKFYQSYYRQYKTKIIKEHFNSKEYLKKVVSQMNDSDSIEEILKSTLIDLKPRKNKPVDAKKES